MSKLVDAKKLKRNLTLPLYEKLLKELNVPIYTKNDKHWILYTGCHNKEAYDGSAKLYFNIETKIFTCFTGCGCSFDIFTLVQKRLTLQGEQDSFVDAVNTILEITDMDTGLVRRINKKKDTYNWRDDFSKFSKLSGGITQNETYDRRIADMFPHIVPEEWYQEGISIDSMLKYKIGFYERTDQTTIPCLDKDGQLVGVRVRNWHPDRIATGKYRPLMMLDGTQYNFPTSTVFYGINYNWSEIERTGTVYLGESEKFVLKMDTWFGDGSVALGMYGNNLGLNRRNQLLKMGVKRVVYVPDNDFRELDSEEFERWEAKVNKMIDLFKGYATVEVVWDEELELGYKNNAADGDLKTWLKLYRKREIIGVS